MDFAMLWPAVGKRWSSRRVQFKLWSLGTHGITITIAREVVRNAN